MNRMWWLLVLAGCGRVATPTPSRPARPPEHPPEHPPPLAKTTPYFGQVIASCGPLDGPATRVVITSEDHGCAEGGLGPHVVLEIWEGTSARSEGVIDLLRQGDAVRCPGDGYVDCERAAAATLEWGVDGAPSRFSLELTDGSVVGGTFTEQHCSFELSCG